MTKLKPCPFCGGRTAEVLKEGHVSKVFCGSCSARGPWHPEPEQAACLWNARVGQPKPKPPVIHFHHYTPPGIPAPACGACGRTKSSTVTEHVTCQACKRTVAYQQKARTRGNPC